MTANTSPDQGDEPWDTIAERAAAPLDLSELTPVLAGMTQEEILRDVLGWTEEKIKERMDNQSRSPSEHSEAARAENSDSPMAGQERCARVEGNACNLSDTFVDVVTLQEQSAAWFAVCGLLTYLRPGWQANYQNGGEAALATIRSIANLATPAEAGERTLPSVDTQEFRNALGEWMAMLDYFQSDEHKEVEDVWDAFIAHINSYGQQCARYAVEEYKRGMSELVTRESAREAIGHVDFYNGPGRRQEALEMLVAHHTDKGD